MLYEKNFLTRVIFQLQFDAELEILSNTDCFKDKVEADYPHREQGFEVALETKVAEKQSLKTELKSAKPRWVFSPDDKSRSITVGVDLFSLEYTTFHSIEDTRTEFRSLWSKFRECYPVDASNRVGLRFINEIRLPTGEPLDWEGYIAKPILDATLGVQSPEGADWARSMHELQWLEDDYRLALRFGIYNNEFPGPVSQRVFILDYDCVSLGSVDAAKAEECLLCYNKRIGTEFERSIDNKLRAEMGETTSIPAEEE